MRRSARLPAGAWSAVVVLTLASFVFLGNPGCGCGDDDLVRRGGTPRCCCDFEWLPPTFVPGDAILSAEGASPGLDVTISPSTFTNAGTQGVVTFTVCIDADHALLDSFVLVARNSPGGTEIGRMSVVYRQRCTPTIGTIAGTAPLNLASPDCGGAPLQCCCTVAWSPTVTVPPGITASLVLVDPSLEPATVTPLAQMTALAPPLYSFEVCVNANHTVPASLVFVLSDTSGEIARLPLTYETTCIATPGDPTGTGSFQLSCGAVDLQSGD
jgi:hypothetical protein